MAAESVVNAVVARGGYAYRGVPFPVGTVVVMTAEQFQATQSIRPPFFREATNGEIARAPRVIDFAEVQRPTARNVAAALEADVGDVWPATPHEPETTFEAEAVMPSAPTPAPRRRARNRSKR